MSNRRQDATPDYATLVAELASGSAGVDADDDVTTRLLDATMAVIGRYGERRLTMDDVAATARVARATVFRRFGSRNALIQRLYLREVRRAIEHIRTAVDSSATAEDAIAEGFASTVTYVNSHVIVRRLADVEPEVLVDLWREGDATGAMFIRALFAAFVLPRDDASGVDPAAFRELCDVLSRLLFSYMLLTDGTPSREALEVLVRQLLDAYPVAVRT